MSNDEKTEELDKFARMLTGLANPLVRKKIAPPDWGRWGGQELVKLWQAVALSLDIDPDRFMPDSSYSTDKALVLVDNVGPAIFAIIERPGHEWSADGQKIEWHGHRWSADDQDRILKFRKEIYQRLIALDINRDMKDLFPNSGDGDKVRLSEFAAWALSIKWDIPQELVNCFSAGNPATNPDPLLNVSAGDNANAKGSADKKLSVDEGADSAAANVRGDNSAETAPQDKDEPKMALGTNPKEACDAWIKWAARKLYEGNMTIYHSKETGDKGLVARIIELANTPGRGYLCKGRALNKEFVRKALPDKITGGHAKNGKSRQKK